MQQNSAPPRDRWSTLLIFAISAIGIPGGLLTLFRDEIQRRPWITLALLGVWEVFVLSVGFMVDVWSKLRGKWVDRLADWLDRRVASVLSGFRHNYLKWLFYQNYDFDVKGLSTQGIYNLELEQVFVDLTIDPRSPHESSLNPLRSPGLEGRRQIWDYLESGTGQFALLGAPGSGKTTLLKKIALRMAGGKRLRIRQSIPILLFLRDYGESISANPLLSLEEAAVSALSRKQGPRSPSGWFTRKLNAGRCLVLLDGLDEVADVATRTKVVNWIEEQIRAYPGSRFLITSRPHGYRTSPLGGVTVLEVQPFKQEQVQQFVFNWYRANEIRASGKIDPGVEMKTREGAEDLLRRLGNSQTLTELSVNPLLLTMIATVHRFRSSLPGRRVELYAEIFEVFLGKRQQARGMEASLTPAQKQRVLQPLAYNLMLSEKREIPLAKALDLVSEPLLRVTGNSGGNAALNFIKDVEGGSGLLLEGESGVYGFAHLAFQEYLAAVHAREAGLERELVERVSNSWWHEVIRLYAAQADASSILAACLGPGRSSIVALSLAIDCLQEAREIAPEWRQKMDLFLNQEIESANVERFHLAAEAILSRRLRNMVALSDNVFLGPEYVTQAEYQIFIDERLADNYFHQPDHWNKLRFKTGDALAPVAGMRPSDVKAFCDWLTKREGSFYFRPPISNEEDVLMVSISRRDTNVGYWEHSPQLGSWKCKLDNVDGVVPGKMIRYLLFDRDLEQARALYRQMRLSLKGNFESYLSNFSAVAVQVSRDRAGSLNLDETLKNARNCLRQTDRFPQIMRSLINRSAFNLAADSLKIDVFTLSEFGAFSIDFILDRSQKQSKNVWSDKDNIQLLTLLRRNTRLIALIASAYLGSLSPAHELGFWRSRLFDKRHDLAKSWLEVYADLVILEARINGELPAVEGIVFLKERRGVSQSS